MSKQYFMPRTQNAYAKWHDAFGGEHGALAEGVHIYTQRDGDAGFNYLSSETHSPYVDNRPLLVAGKPETRRYKAIFFNNKVEIGLESDVVEATARP